MHQTTYYLDANVTQAWHWLVEGPIRHLRGAHALSQRLWKIQGEVGREREGKGIRGIYSWGKNGNWHERGTRWLCRWIGPLSRDEFNRKFCTGFPVSISFPRASTSPPHLLSALQSPNLRFSRDFSASSKMKGSLSNLFQRSSCSLSMETVRFPLIFGNFALVEQSFFTLFIFPFFFLSNEFCPRLDRKIARRFRVFVRVAGVSIFNYVRLIRLISEDRNNFRFILLENIDRFLRKF